jgi:hypothetical protein
LLTNRLAFGCALAAVMAAGAAAGPALAADEPGTAPVSAGAMPGDPSADIIGVCKAGGSLIVVRKHGGDQNEYVTGAGDGPTGDIIAIL